MPAAHIPSANQSSMKKSDVPKKSVKKSTVPKKLASNDNISKDVQLTCKDKIKNKNTCKDLHEDPKYFIRRLQRHDVKLFKNQYSRNCNSENQPFALSYDPSKKKSINIKSFTSALKHSSNPKEFDRWYICPKYWCPYCEIPIAESDIDIKTIKTITNKKKSGLLFKKTAKCPYGNHRVFIKEKDAYYPGFLQNTNPDGLKLPCCFRKEMKK
jgi:hypothetical protein